MRSPALLSLLLLCGWTMLCGWATQAEARLFWQTHGSVVPTADGGCAWNTNSDYFVPRHCDSCRYGLFSPCKCSCTTSPACRRCHALYLGYCSPYGCFHYCWRNHIYARKCGCCPVAYCGPYRPGCGPHLLCQHGCRGGMCAAGPICPTNICADGLYPMEGCFADRGMPGEECQYLANVESAEFQILGSISLAGDPLLTSLQLGDPAGIPLLPAQALPGQTLPSELPVPQPAIPKIPVDPQSPLYGNPAAVEHIPQPGQ